MIFAIQGDEKWYLVVVDEAAGLPCASLVLATSYVFDSSSFVFSRAFGVRSSAAIAWHAAVAVDDRVCTLGPCCRCSLMLYKAVDG